jgi:hypothetical protein
MRSGPARLVPWIAVVVLVLCRTASAATDDRGEAPWSSPVPCRRLGWDGFRDEAIHRREGIHLRLAVATADAASRERTHAELQRLHGLGHASEVEIASAALERDLARDRAAVLRDLAATADQVLARLPEPGAGSGSSGDAGMPAGPAVRLKVPGLTRRIGVLEFFTVALPEGWAPDVPDRSSLPPAPEFRWPGAEWWADRVDALEELGSVREAERDSARLHHLAARFQAWTLASSARDTERLLRFFRSGSGPWPVTAEDAGAFATSWRRSVPPRGPHLAPSVAWAEAAAAQRGELRLREIEVRHAAGNVDRVRVAVDRGTASRGSLTEAETEHRTASARRDAAQARIRVREAERDWLRDLAGPGSAAPSPSGSPAAATSPPTTVWVLGRLRLEEQRALAGSAVREAERRLAQARDRREFLRTHPARRDRDVAAADREVERREAHLLSAREARVLADLELAQWESVRGLAGGEESSPAPEAEADPAPPPELLPSWRALADAEADAAEAGAATFRPEEARLRERVRELDRLQSRGAARPYETAQARDAWRIAAAQAEAARRAEALAHARRDFVAAYRPGMSVPSLAPHLQRCQRLEAEAWAVVAEGIEAASSRARRRADELERLARSGHAAATELARARASGEAHAWLRSAHDARETVRGIEAVVLAQALAVPPAPEFRPRTFELPVLE